MTSLTYDSSYEELWLFLRVLEWAEGGDRFMKRLERWLDNPAWRCQNGHVSTAVLLSEEYGANLCLACRKPVALTFPEDREWEPCLTVRQWVSGEPYPFGG